VKHSAMERKEKERKEKERKEKEIGMSPGLGIAARWVVSLYVIFGY